MMTRLSDLVEYHLKVSPIVYKYLSKNENTGVVTVIYMIRSIKRENQSYNVVKENGLWSCDCPSFKFRSGVDAKGHCKHIQLVVFLLENNVEIKEA